MSKKVQHIELIDNDVLKFYYAIQQVNQSSFKTK
jgi:hypothetical protein